MSKSKESSRKSEKTVIDQEPSCSNLLSLFDEFVIDESKKAGQKRGRVKADVNVNMLPKIKIRPPSQWFSVYNARKPMEQRYHYNLNDGELLQHIERGISDKLRISCVSCCSNLWAIVMDAETDYTDQACKLSLSFLPKEWILEQWSKNFYITSFAGSKNRSSVVVMSKGARYSQQSYKESRSFPYLWVNKKWKEGFHVTSMGTAGTRWCIVMSRNSGFSDQVVEVNFDYPSEVIQKRLDQGYMITATAASFAQSAVILSIPKNKLLGYETQEALVTPKFPSDHVKGKWPKNFYLSHLCNGPTVRGFPLPSKFD